MGTWRALAIAIVIEAALAKRSSGSLARLRSITFVKAGEIFGLIRAGDGGIAFTCCIISATGLVP